METTVTIPKAEYDTLKTHFNLLRCLEALGVDEWEGYEDAMEMHLTWLRQEGEK